MATCCVRADKNRHQALLLGFLKTSVWSWCLAIAAGFAFAMIVPLFEWFFR